MLVNECICIELEVNRGVLGANLLSSTFSLAILGLLLGFGCVPNEDHE